MSKSIVVPLPKVGNKNPPGSSIPKSPTVDVPIPLSGHSSDSNSTCMMSLVSSSKPSSIIVLLFLLTVKKPSAQLSSLKSRFEIMPSARTLFPMFSLPPPLIALGSSHTVSWLLFMSPQLPRSFDPFTACSPDGRVCLKI